MALAKSALGHNIDVHAEEVLDRVRKADEREQALAWWNRDKQIEVTPWKVVAAGDRPEHARVRHSEVVRQTSDFVAVGSQRCTRFRLCRL